MKKKIINVVIDILLIAVVFSFTEIVLLDVFHSESMWLELGIYIVMYGMVFGAKRGIVYLWKKKHMDL